MKVEVLLTGELREFRSQNCFILLERLLLLKVKTLLTRDIRESKDLWKVAWNWELVRLLIWKFSDRRVLIWETELEVSWSHCCGSSRTLKFYRQQQLLCSPGCSLFLTENSSHNQFTILANFLSYVHKSQHLASIHLLTWGVGCGSDKFSCSDRDDIWSVSWVVYSSLMLLAGKKSLKSWEEEQEIGCSSRIYRNTKHQQLFSSK